MTTTEATTEAAMTGILALHGGGEFHPADDAFLAALLRSAGGRRREAHGAEAHAASRPLRTVIVTTASARYDPGATAAFATRALEQVASALHLQLDIAEARAVDPTSAADPAILARIAAADLVHIPGGDPGVVLDVLADSPALDAIRRAWRQGAAVAGASAGAMAFGRVTWTPGGLRPGFGWAGDLIVVPHAAEARLLEAIRQRATVGDPRIGILGLAECTGVIRDGGGRWRVEGAGSAWWVPPGGRTPSVVPAGEVIELSAAA